MQSVVDHLPLVVCGLAVLFLVLALSLWQAKRRWKRVAEQQQTQYQQLEKEMNKTSKQVLELRSVVVGLGQRISEYKETIQHLSERVNELENTDSDARLYSRASKMVKLGAGVNELIAECELPKAEAELMLSLQKKLQGQESVPPLEKPTARFSSSDRGSRPSSPSA